jgi:Flp pilus assembly protein TadD
LRLKPDYAEAHYNLGLALIEAGKPVEARAEMEKAYRLAPYLKTLLRETP